MSRAMDRWRSRLWWLVPVLALGVLLGIELGWGRQVHRLPEPGPALESRPVTPALLPEYKIEGGLAGRAETVNRTLFNPTRRPAPTAVADTGRPQMQRGQFVLTGTSLAGERSIAFLKEVAGGKARTVRQGEQINGMQVAEVKSDRVRLTLGGDAEELVLRVAAGPKTTVNPIPPVAAPPGGANPAANPFGGAPPAPQLGAPAGAQSDPAQLLEQRRRAARAATATEAAPPPAPVPGRSTLLPGSTQPAAGQGAAASPDPAWNEVYERMRQRGQPFK
jgi:hypothetical protein